MHRGRIYETDDGLPSSSARLYTELFWDNGVDGHFYTILPEHAGSIAHAVESAILQSSNVEEADERIAGAYGDIFHSFLDQNITRLRSSKDSGSMPEGTDLAYASRLMRLADELGLGDAVRPVYERLGITFSDIE